MVASWLTAGKHPKTARSGAIKAPLAAYGNLMALACRHINIGHKEVHLPTFKPRMHAVKLLPFFDPPTFPHGQLQCYLGTDDKNINTTLSSKTYCLTIKSISI